ncbi:MAG: response regulator [Deltaproteobacteria bacterium]|nr:MAG: response regulator [Deltaproteobacteria bacterium]
MTEGLDVIIVDDEPAVCDAVSEIVRSFYSWGEVHAFTDFDEAISFCLKRQTGVAIFILDVFMGERTGFVFLDEIEERFPMAHEDAIIMTGYASDEVVNMCIASDINHLLEKPIRPYALQLAVRAIVSKYIRFAKKLLGDPAFAKHATSF